MSDRRRRDEATAQERAAKREQLLDAAVRAVRTAGISVSMDQMAAEAGITKPILYRHFGDRNGLVTALGTRFAAEVQARLTEALDAGTDARAVVSAAIDAYLRVVEDDPEVYRFIVQRVVAEQPGAAAALGDFVRQVGNQVALVLGEQLREAGLDSGGAEPMAHGIVGMVHAAGDWWVERRTIPRTRLVTYLTDLVWGGISGLGLRAAPQPAPVQLLKEEA